MLSLFGACCIFFLWWYALRQFSHLENLRCLCFVITGWCCASCHLPTSRCSVSWAISLVATRRTHAHYYSRRRSWTSMLLASGKPQFHFVIGCFFVQIFHCCCLIFLCLCIFQFKKSLFLSQMYRRHDKLFCY